MRFSLGEVLVEPFDIISRNVGFFILPVLPAILNTLAEYVRYSSTSTVLSIVVEIIALVVSLMVSGALIYMANEELEGRSVSYVEAINYTLGILPNLLVASIIIAIGAIIGFALLIIPGLVWLFLVIFTLQEIVIGGKDAISAIQGSIDIVKQNAIDLIVYFVVLIVIAIVIVLGLSFIPLVGYFIASIILESYGSISLTMVYRKLTESELSTEVF